MIALLIAIDSAVPVIALLAWLPLAVALARVML